MSELRIVDLLRRDVERLERALKRPITRDEREKRAAQRARVVARAKERARIVRLIESLPLNSADRSVVRAILQEVRRV